MADVRMVHIVLEVMVHDASGRSPQRTYESIEEGRARGILAFNKFEKELGDKDHWFKIEGGRVIYRARLEEVRKLSSLLNFPN